ncbi:alpha/beta hydrolase [Aeromonas caviae]|uniref:alpha/beta hydrolase n=1 Tax=Aeromonas caviae TaxID=648 RepID=UPI00191FB6E5|nr:alpha/beta hydrolase [Aeromonas caviae]MBL0648853.1 alpha/beta hydrolase [Aeromonas caviae]
MAAGPAAGSDHREMAASVGLDPDLPHPASAYVARKLLERCAGTGSTAKQKLKTGKHLLLFVHGFNNDLDDVLERAAGLEARYGVEVLCFSWPANGGGARGVLSYKSDKRDVLASAGALDRVLEKMKGLLDEFNGQYVTQLEEKAQKKFTDNGEAWDRYFAKEVNKRCPFTINLLLHSMGNYLFKHLLSSTTYHANQLLFDNIIMAAADTNNELHAQWVDRIQCRNRLYITINECDGALMASRMKMGEQQKARLGHYTRRLDARTATYVDVTNQPHVGDSHAYFEGDALANEKVLRFFHTAFNGGTGERAELFDAAQNLYRL